MPSRLLVRRSVTAVGIYSSVVLGFLGTVVAARTFDTKVFGLFTLVITSTGLFQSFFDVTVEEALVKYGFRYRTQEDWGRLQRLFRAAGGLKLAGGAAAGLGLLVLAPFADSLFGDSRLTAPLLVAAAIPPAQSLEGLAGAALYLRERYDVRSGFLTVSMALRFCAIAVGSQYGLTEAVLGIVVAQIAATGAIGLVGLNAFRRFPVARPQALDVDRRGIVRFVLQSSVATGVLSLRGALAPFLLGVVTSPAQVGFFRVAQAPQQAMQALSAPARMVLLTEQTRDWERGRQHEVLRGVRRYSLWAALLMLVVVPIAVWLMPDLVRLVYSARYLPATDAARIFVLAAAVQFVVGWTKSFPVSIGRPTLRIVTHGAETLVVLPLVVVLGWKWEATGAAVAVLAGMVVFALMWAAIFLRLHPDEHPTEPEVAAAAEAGAEALAR
jgi:O-antigen/teichoic acid export membrane protein